MRLLLMTGAVALLFTSPAQAQLAPPNADGVTFAHVHLNVTDIDAHTKIWVEQFGGVAVQKGFLRTVKFPNMLVVFNETPPSGGSQGSVMDHFGFKVRNIAAALDRARRGAYGDSLPSVTTVTANQMTTAGTDFAIEVWAVLE